MASRPYPTRSRDAFFASLPPPWAAGDLASQLACAVRASQRKIVVLDDDPTGTQTVHGVYVLATWTPADLAQALSEPEPAFYILTNSRSLPQAEAIALNQEIGHSLAAAARATGRQFVVVSRSDSTLRGHYPAEVDALAATLEAELGIEYDGILIVPFFLEGGRFTVDDVHWVLQGDRLIPAGETEFARDPTFGYRESDLRRWVLEKTGGRIPAASVISIPLSVLRGGGPAAVERILRSARGRAPIVANAAAYADLEVLVAALLAAEQDGRRFLYRTAASFVRVRGAISARGLLTPADLFPFAPRRAPGLVLVGSHVQRSTEQLRALLELPGTTAIEISVPEVLDGARRQAALAATAEAAAAGLAGGRDVVIATSREVIAGDASGDKLAVGQVVSAAVCEVTRQVVARVQPGFIVAKGGITSSDIATQALGMRRALVLGQIQPGVPVWQAGPESLLPGTPYVVFPGNVGAPDTLRQIVADCRP